MAFHIFDDDSSALITVDLNRMKIDGDNFGEDTGTTCYLPVFMSKHSGTQNTWFFGSMLMEDHILIFDNTGYDERGASHNIVSFGKKNHATVQQEIKKNYDPTSPNFSHSPDDTTISTLAPPPDEKKDDDVIPDISGDSDSSSQPSQPKDSDSDSSSTTSTPNTDTDSHKRIRPGQQPAGPIDKPPPAGLTPEYIIFMVGKLLSMTSSFESIFSSVWNFIKAMTGKK